MMIIKLFFYIQNNGLLNFTWLSIKSKKTILIMAL